MCAASVFCVLCSVLYLGVVLCVSGVCIALVGVCVLVAKRERVQEEGICLLTRDGRDVEKSSLNP